MNESPVIVGLGAQTPVGLNLPSNVAAVRAGVNCFQISDYLLGYKQGEPLKVSQLPTLSKDMAPFERMKSMALAAATEALEPWLQHPVQGTEELAIFLAVPSQRPGIQAGLGKQLIQEIIAGLPIKADKRRCRLAVTEHEGGLAALGYAANLIRAGAGEAVLVGGVECYHQIETLHWLETQDRLKVEKEPNGLIPGEGAGFVLLCSAAVADRANLPVFAEMVAAGRGIEPRLRFSGEPTVGEGLTQAFQAMFSDPYCPQAQVRAIYCDLNGESWRVDEWCYSYVRTGTHHASPLDLHHPAANWGDVGAASGPLLVSLASFELVRYYEAQDLALVWAASDMQAYRSACLLRRPQEIVT
jgi:3-oxoacyl-[acyl-carrier-protein] synthase-1